MDVLSTAKGKLLRLELNIQMGREKPVRQQLWKERNILSYLAEEAGLSASEWNIKEARKKASSSRSGGEAKKDR